MMVPDRVVGFHGGDEVARNELGALMDELIEGMLPVGARLTPDDGAGRDVYRLAVTVDVLAVALHVALLKVGGETVHVLVIRQNRLRLGAKEIVVPDTEQAHSGRQVLLQRRGPEVFVHVVATAEQFLEIVKTDRNGNGQA